MTSYDEQKLTELILYAAGRLQDDPTYGATKLNKALYFAEFGHVRGHGSPITGAEYQRLPRGPAPRRLVPIRTRLIASGQAELVERDYKGRTQHRLIPLRSADLTVFTDDEKESIEAAIAMLRGYNGSEASDLSHHEMGWQMVAEGETIPFESAYLRPVTMTDSIRDHARALAERLT